MNPLPATGPGVDHLLAFDRGGAITIATRLPVGLANRGGFETTTVDLDGDYTDQFSGNQFSGRVAVADILSLYPAALLTQD